MSATLALGLPLIIQGGMGIGVSDWKLARAVSLRGQLGVVSGTCIDSVFIRRLQDGDIGGHLRRAMEHFPIPDVSADALKKYFLPEGRIDGAPYKLLPVWKQKVGRAREQLAVLSSFVEVYLAKAGHGGPVGMNLLTKVQMPNLATLYGAMLAGVDYVLMGAGIPREIPGVLDAFAEGHTATMHLDVDGLERADTAELTFEPAEHFEGSAPQLRRPRFLPIISAHSLAMMLTRKATGRVDGFVIEGPTAGGHNAPPRGRLELDGRGEPVYGERDLADLGTMRELGLPFWLAGGTGSPDAVVRALGAGAAGVQVGTLFAWSNESGIDAGLKQRVLAGVGGEALRVKTDMRASPTGFPFKVVELKGTNASAANYERRERVCDLGYLRQAYRREDGRIDYRCAAEPVDTYLKKGGKLEDTVGRKCLCNGLMADIGLPQMREDGPELAILTSGDDLVLMEQFLAGRDSYSAGDVLDYLLSGMALAGAGAMAGMGVAGEGGIA